MKIKEKKWEGYRTRSFPYNTWHIFVRVKVWCCVWCFAVLKLCRWCIMWSRGWKVKMVALTKPSSLMPWDHPNHETSQYHVYTITKNRSSDEYQSHLAFTTMNESQVCFHSRIDRRTKYEQLCHQLTIRFKWVCDVASMEFLILFNR